MKGGLGDFPHSFLPFVFASQLSHFMASVCPGHSMRQLAPLFPKAFPAL